MNSISGIESTNNLYNTILPKCAMCFGKNLNKTRKIPNAFKLISNFQRDLLTCIRKNSERNIPHHEHRFT